MKFNFSKYHGAGNDFIISDQLFLLDKIVERNNFIIESICDRRLGIGSDGLILIEKKSDGDLKFYFFNSDGKRGSLCGNGGRCALAFALGKGYLEKGVNSFMFWDKRYEAFCDENGIQIKMKDIESIVQTEIGHFIDTGSPHLIIEKDLDGIEKDQLRKEALFCRHHPIFESGGTNVNFLHPAKIKENHYRLITFERGVEDFTYACGTGAVAVAAYLSNKNQSGGTYNIASKGGKLMVKIGNYSKNLISDIWLSGPTQKVFEGTLDDSLLEKMVDSVRNSRKIIV